MSASRREPAAESGQRKAIQRTIDEPARVALAAGRVPRDSAMFQPDSRAAPYRGSGARTGLSTGTFAMTSSMTGTGDCDGSCITSLWATVGTRISLIRSMVT